MMPWLSSLTAWTIVNRTRRAIAEAPPRRPSITSKD